MTTIKYFLSFVLISIFLVNNVNAQDNKAFQGTVSYKISPVGEVDPATAMQLPKVSILTIKDNKSKKVTTQGAVVITELTDGTAKTSTILIEMPDGKYAIKTNEKDIKEGLEKNKESIPTLKFSEETKEIAGYKCKKVEAISKDDDGKEVIETIYYTEEIGGKDFNFNSAYGLIPGLMMEYEVQATADLTIKYTASEIKKSKVSDKTFLAPSDYKELTKEEAKKMFGQ
jgi:GLPGLI family protein